jgi:hypothetical protein
MEKTMVFSITRGGAAMLCTIMLSAAAWAGTAHPNMHKQELSRDNPSYQEIVVKERAARYRQEHQPPQAPAPVATKASPPASADTGPAIADGARETIPIRGRH